ncbi:hypothetical protein DID96_30605 [Burkholderia sp. Bp8963]|nr:hypothetical protein DID96_30605 [Burkholderia sp. Bp8963]
MYTPYLGKMSMMGVSARPHVLARVRTRNDDFSTYQGYRRYAEIVAARARNAQDARIFAT